MENKSIVEMSMYITKATMDGKVMRWAATNSDTDWDSYEERMSLELYSDFIGHIKNKESIPEPFKSAACSDFWCGGMPYLSISHYPDLNGQAVPGEVMQLFVDGNKLKAKGVLYNSPLGHSVFRSLQQDKNKTPENKIRISIGFLDLAHKHGDNGKVWVRDSLTAVCPECLQGVGDKVYVKGYLVHLALTRVPVNKRTEMVLEEKSEMGKKAITRKDDAASIVGEELASEIDLKNKATALKSDAMIEMSEGEATPEVVEAPAEPVQAVVEESMSNDEPEKECSDGDMDCEDEAKKEKSEPVEKMMDPGMLPYGGATSMAEAKKAKEAIEEMSEVMGMWGMFSNVAWNIIDRDDVPDKKKAFVKALDEFKSMLAAKAMVEFSQAVPYAPVVEKSETNDHELKPALDALLTAIDNSVSFEGDINSKLQTVQPVLQEFGQAITDYVSRKSVVEVPAPDKNTENLLDDIKKLIQPLSESINTVAGELGVLKAQVNATSVQPKARIPAPRSAQLPPKLVAKSEDEPKPGSLKSIARKSVGLES